MAYANERPPSRMSTTSSVASNAIDRLKEMNTCTKCDRYMSDFRMLPCSHTFCADCIRQMISSATRNEFLCPKDRMVIPVPSGGMESFPVNTNLKEIQGVIFDLEQGLFLEDPETADLDINLESLNKGVKDLEHSSAISQHDVNETFENIYRMLKKKQEEFIQDIKRKSKKQISLLEYEKFRLIETKQYQNAQLTDSLFYHESVGEMAKMFDHDGSIVNSSPPSPSTVRSGQSSYPTVSTEQKLTLLACHIGQQHLEFQSNNKALQKLEENLGELGSVLCEFDLKVKLDRNLLALEEFPFGMKIGGNENPFDWHANQPKGISKRHQSTSLYVVNSGSNEIVQMDNSFNVKRVISGRGLFSNNITDVASCGGYIYVVDSGACQIVMLNEDGTLVKKLGRPGNGNLELKRPSGICIDGKGRVIVSDSLNHRIKVFSADLKSCLLTITNDKKKYKEASRFSFPCGVSVDKDDNIYIVDTNNKRLVQVSREGKFKKEIFPTEVDDPRCVAVSNDQRIILTDRENAKVLIFDSTGHQMTRVFGISDSSGRKVKFKGPYGVAVDGSDKIYVTDLERNAVFVL